MKKIINLAAAVLLGLTVVACASPEKMAKQAENVIVTCDPGVLEAIAGQVTAAITVTYPENYFHPKAILEVTPVIVYEGGEQAAAPLYYQGEKVKDNYKVVPSAGSTVTEVVSFPYVKGMEKSYLELRGVASCKTKSVNLPSKKVADGVNTTYMLVNKNGTVSFKADNYQEIIKQTEEGQILYTINSANVRNSEIKSESIKNFQAALDEISANERKTLTGTEVVAYASPDGGEKLNNKLSDNRANSAEKAWTKVTKGHEASAPEVKSIGQDWEGFQELVSNSNIEDKDLILRVLSMYSDPAVRENEIKNMSEIYKELKGGVLPELRRARFIANVEYKNYTPEELTALIDENIDVLDEEALLRAATLVKDTDKKIEIYKKAVSKFGSDRARFNIGTALLNSDNLAAAKEAFAKVITKDADLKNAEGVIALREGDLQKAAQCFNAAGTADAVENMGVIDILTGNYTKAAQELANSNNCCNKALAYLLTNQLGKVNDAAKCCCPTSQYIKAIAAARQGKATEAKKLIDEASKCDCLKNRAAKDIEFATIQ